MKIVYLMGRCANGFERDSGRMFHAIAPGNWRALCGKGYGRMSAGWADADSTVTEPTCPRCKKKATALTVAGEHK